MSDLQRSSARPFLVLSTDDPVPVFQRFSTLTAVTSGRAEVILGRGSFTEWYPLFGYDMAPRVHDAAQAS